MKTKITKLLSCLLCLLLVATLCPIATVAETTTEEIPDLSAYVKDPVVSTVTDFNTVGAGTLANVPTTSVVSVTEDYRLSVVRNGGDWYQTMDWQFTQSQNWTGMAGILVKVDFTKANTNSTSGGHGISLGIHTAKLGDSVVNNDTALGGSYAYNIAKSSWNGMVPSGKYSNILVVDPTVYSRYAGYVYIPLSAFGEAGIAGLDQVTAITLYVGTNTSGTAYIDGIYLVKGTQRLVDLSAFAKNAEISTATDFATVGAGSLNVSDTTITTATVTENQGISVQRATGSGVWYQQFDWTFTEKQDWTDAVGILVKVDYTSANSGTNGGHGVSIGIHTSELEDTVSYNDPTLGGYAYNIAKTAWQKMGACVKSNHTQLLVVDPTIYKSYAGYVYIPMTSFRELVGLDEVTAISVYTGAITSGTAYIESVSIVKGDVVPTIDVTAVQDTLALGNDTYNVRFLATVNSLNIQSYSFTLAATFTQGDAESQTVTKTYSDLTTVYKSVYADGALVDAPYNSYYAPLSITAIPKDVTVTFAVTPSWVLMDGTTVTGEAVTYTVTAAA